MKPGFILGLLGAVILAGCLPRPAAPAVFGPPAPEAPKAKTLGQVSDFTLIDSENRQFRFGENPQGLSVVSFAFTHCADVCPYVLLKMKAAWDLLEKDSGKVRLVGISVDPERDTPEVLKAYLQDLALSGQVQFLTGDRKTLEPVWKNFGVVVKTTPSHEETLETSQNAEALGMHMPESPEALVQKGLTQDTVLLARRVVGKYTGGYDVLHTSPFWIVNSQGTILAQVDYDRTPAQLAQEIRKHLP